MSLPEFKLGDPMPVVANPSVLDSLARRRSSPAQGLGLPGPSPEQVETLIRLGARAPDHGKLGPWRFVVMQPAAKARLVERLKTIAATRDQAEQRVAKLAKLALPPVTIMVVARPVRGKIPEWEQVLSVGAVCQNMTVAAAAMGFGSSWITDWYAYDADAAALMGIQAGERIAGFIHVGTVAEPPLERDRPDVAARITYWED